VELLDLRNMTITEIEEFILGLGEKKYRARQLYEWINKHGSTDFSTMTNLPASLITKISGAAVLPTLEIQKKIVSEDNFTIKFLFSTRKDIIIDNGKVLFESVLLRYNHGNTVCISSQAGCRMACAFCASGKNGFIRNLSAGEMAAQVYAIARNIGENISNVVLMGCGEPFDNFEQTLKFIQIINSHEGANIGRRHITVSTCGLTDRIWELLERDLQITLAVSLHAPNDEIRRKIMPINKKYPLDDLLQACKSYADKTKRRISFEYALIEGVNDSAANAEELAKRLRNMLCHVNLIPFNAGVSPTQPAVKINAPLRASSKETVEHFAKILNSNNIDTTIRRRLGGDISAACGQLVSTYRE